MLSCDGSQHSSSRMNNMAGNRVGRLKWQDTRTRRSAMWLSSQGPPGSVRPSPPQFVFVKTSGFSCNNSTWYSSPRVAQLRLRVSLSCGFLGFNVCAITQASASIDNVKSYRPGTVKQEIVSPSAIRLEPFASRVKPELWWTSHGVP